MPQTSIPRMPTPQPPSQSLVVQLPYKPLGWSLEPNNMGVLSVNHPIIDCSNCLKGTCNLSPLAIRHAPGKMGDCFHFAPCRTCRILDLECEMSGWYHTTTKEGSTLWVCGIPTGWESSQSSEESQIVDKSQEPVDGNETTPQPEQAEPTPPPVASSSKRFLKGANAVSARSSSPVIEFSKLQEQPLVQEATKAQALQEHYFRLLGFEKVTKKGEESAGAKLAVKYLVSWKYKSEMCSTCGDYTEAGFQCLFPDPPVRDLQIVPDDDLGGGEGSGAAVEPVVQKEKSQDEVGNESNVQMESDAKGKRKADEMELEGNPAKSLSQGDAVGFKQQKYMIKAKVVRCRACVTADKVCSCLGQAISAAVVDLREKV